MLSLESVCRINLPHTFRREICSQTQKTVPSKVIGVT